MSTRDYAQSAKAMVALVGESVSTADDSSLLVTAQTATTMALLAIHAQLAALTDAINQKA
ncbi:hypothetical protein [Mycobacterium sp. NS-7484]|uniref:hypothetical protein n=1 Tax=Mycobacterium sp. NS-7484 TaxID=1834161 RepID=UPI001154DD11|nr:hypothetical protein [Mycobacterium sp. NS-7484]